MALKIIFLHYLIHLCGYVYAFCGYMSTTEPLGISHWKLWRTDTLYIRTFLCYVIVEQKEKRSFFYSTVRYSTHSWAKMLMHLNISINKQFEIKNVFILTRDMLMNNILSSNNTEQNFLEFNKEICNSSLIKKYQTKVS